MKLNMRIKSLTPYLMVVLLVGLQACGGGSSTPAPTPDANPTGYYDITGTATVKEIDDTTDLVVTDLQAIISNNRIMIISYAKGLVYDGTMTIDKNSYIATVKVYKDGINPVDATIAGTITEGSSITGTLTGTGAGNGTFNLTYATSNNTAANITRITSSGSNAEWAGRLYDPTNKAGIDYQYQFTVTGSNNFVDLDGAVAGTFAGCSFNGTITPITGTSVYAINVTEGNTCGVGGAIRGETYTGFAVTRTESTTDDTIVYAITNGTTFAVMTEAI